MRRGRRICSLDLDSCVIWHEGQTQLTVYSRTHTSSPSLSPPADRFPFVYSFFFFQLGMSGMYVLESLTAVPYRLPLDYAIVISLFLSGYWRQSLRLSGFLRCNRDMAFLGFVILSACQSSVHHSSSLFYSMCITYPSHHMWFLNRRNQTGFFWSQTGLCLFSQDKNASFKQSRKSHMKIRCQNKREKKQWLVDTNRNVWVKKKKREKSRDRRETAGWVCICVRL